MRLCLLASGSNGNACFVEAGSTRLLIDLGIGPRVLGWRLEPLGVRPADLSDVLLTHEHTDHVKGLEGLLKRRPDLVIHATRSTRRSLPVGVRARARDLRPEQPFDVGDFRVTAFVTSHDVGRSVGYRLEAAGAVLGYATDLGTFGARVVAALSGAHALVVESNHCAEMLATGPYPDYLKRRVAGPQGHLSNDQCRDLLERVIHPGLAHVTLAHLSAENNTPQVAWESIRSLREAHPGIRWALGSRTGPLPPVVIGAPGDAGAPGSGGQQRLPF